MSKAHYESTCICVGMKTRRMGEKEKGGEVHVLHSSCLPPVAVPALMLVRFSGGA